MSEYRKVYVEVITKFTPEGKIIPLSLLWENGVIYKIDRAKDSAVRAGKKYECRIRGLKTYIYLEDNRWFVEAKVYDNRRAKHYI